MGNIYNFRTNDTDWLAEGFVGDHAEFYFQHLIVRKYAAGTIRSYLSSIAHFSQWAKSKQIQPYQVDESLVTEFLDTHLPNCCCVKPVHRERYAAEYTRHYSG